MEDASVNDRAADLHIVRDRVQAGGPSDSVEDGAEAGPAVSHPDVERLTRWTAAGGRWRVVVRTPASLTVALLTCDGGEEMERIVSSDSAFVEHVNASPDNEP